MERLEREVREGEDRAEEKVEESVEQQATAAPSFLQS